MLHRIGGIKLDSFLLDSVPLLMLKPLLVLLAFAALAMFIYLTLARLELILSRLHARPVPMRHNAQRGINADGN